MPVFPVKYCRQPWGAFVLLLQGTWVTLMVKALVVAVLLDPKLAVRTLHCGEAWRYMWRPVLVPQMTGGAAGEKTVRNNTDPTWLAGWAVTHIFPQEPSLRTGQWCRHPDCWPSRQPPWRGPP